MNKFILLILSIILGITYGWSGIFIGWLLMFVLSSSTFNPGIPIFILPLIFCFLTSRYFIKKNWGISQ